MVEPVSFYRQDKLDPVISLDYKVFNMTLSILYLLRKTL